MSKESTIVRSPWIKTWFISEMRFSLFRDNWPVEGSIDC